MEKNKLIILDRDGVININSNGYITSLQKFKLIVGSIDAIVALSKLDYKIAICTNQSAIARGLLSVAELNKMHEYLCKLVNDSGGNIFAIEFCPHHPNNNCDCRKPNSLMLERIINRLHPVDLSSLYMVGDSYTDLLAVQKVGGIPILVKTGHGLHTISKYHLNDNLLIFDNLSKFADYLCYC